ncbi:MAG: c-type cytochrome [Chromatiales bacterium]|nr:c-type cytochrome [Chromatiales bacterium]
MRAAGTLCVGLAMLACVPLHAEEDFARFEDPHLQYGRGIWLDHCATCHAFGVAGAPNPRRPGQWRARLEKPLGMLHAHAIEGFFGSDDAYMPPRGGNPDLSDPEVIAAVDYMAALARLYLYELEKQP